MGSICFLLRRRPGASGGHKKDNQMGRRERLTMGTGKNRKTKTSGKQPSLRLLASQIRAFLPALAVPGMLVPGLPPPHTPM